MLGINSAYNMPGMNLGQTNNLSYGSKRVLNDIKVQGGNEALAKNYTSERAAKRAGVVECETCANRKYQDGSDENVSFKSAQHVSPEASGARVRGHEQEHVSNARAEGQKENKELLSVSVTLHTSICPECGRVYVAGGETRTQMKTSNGNDNDDNAAKAMLDGYKGVANPYEREMNKQLSMFGSGLNADLTA